MRHRKNVVLSYIEGYSAKDIRPFVSSLRDTCYEGDIVFFTFKVHPDCQFLFDKYGVCNVPVRRIDMKNHYRFENRVASLLGIDDKPFIPDISINQRLSKFIAYLDAADLSVSRSIVKRLWHCNSARFLYYEDFLEDRSYDHVLLTDVRDVFFQSNPFHLDVQSEFCVAEEHPVRKIDEQNNNADWIRRAYGQSALDALAGLPIICAGVTIGTKNKILNYLSYLNRDIISRHIGWGTDQGAHNYIIRNILPRETDILRYGEGPVTHVGIAPRSSIQIDSRGRVVNEDGQPFSIVHQYDRHPDVEALLLDQLNQPEEPDPTLP